MALRVTCRVSRDGFVVRVEGGKRVPDEVLMCADMDLAWRVAREMSEAETDASDLGTAP